MALAGVSDVYSKSNDLLNAFLGINICESQVYRVTDCLGHQLTANLRGTLAHPPLKEDQRVYASMDGSMIQMDQGWQEIKLGRVFREDSRLENGTQGQGEIRYKLDESIYSGALGSHTDFIPKFEASLGTYKNHKEQLVFITDGAAWIQKYLAESFSESTHILDYYHAVEHLADFAKSHFSDSVKAKHWVESQKVELLEGSTQNVIDTLSQLRNLSTTAKEQQIKLMQYYKNNIQRMNYKVFRNQGLMIGSGPMEAAHRTVIQTRMKRSGQRWTTAGAQAMINLRVIKESKRWEDVSQLLRNAA